MFMIRAWANKGLHTEMKYLLASDNMKDQCYRRDSRKLTWALNFRFLTRFIANVNEIMNCANMTNVFKKGWQT